MPEISPGEYVDLWVNVPSAERRTDTDPNIEKWFAKSSPDILGGVTPQMMFEKMDAAGVQIGLLTAGIGGVPKNPYVGGYNDLTSRNGTASARPSPTSASSSPAVSTVPACWTPLRA